MAKSKRLTVALALAAALAITACLIGVRQAAQQAPAFYLQALAAEPQNQEQAAEQFELRTIALHNALRHDGHWSLEFTQNEINGWLATELPAKFPGLLPNGVSQPRIAIAARQVQLAARYQRHGVETVVSLIGDVHLTTQPNEIAVRLSRVRAGSLPMPLGKLLEEISMAAVDAGIPVRWSEMAGDPVAILKLPSELNERPLTIDAVELRNGTLALAGRMGQPRQAAMAESTQQADRSGASDTQPGGRR